MRRRPLRVSSINRAMAFSWRAPTPEPGGGAKLTTKSIGYQTNCGLEALQPGTQLDLQAPGAARLLEHSHVGLGDGGRVEQAIGLSGIARPTTLGVAYPAVNDEVGHMNALRLQLTRHRLGQSAQGELAHREGCGLGVALDAGRGAGEENRPLTLPQHALGRRLRHQKAAKSRDLDRPLHLAWIEIQEGAAGTIAGIVEHEVEPLEAVVQVLEQGRDGIEIGGIDFGPVPADLLCQAREFCGVACGKGHAVAIGVKGTGERGTDAGAGADDESDLGHLGSFEVGGVLMLADPSPALDPKPQGAARVPQARGWALL